MKNLIFSTFAIFFFSATLFATGGDPILKHNPAGYDTVAVRKFAMSGTLLSNNWGKYLIVLVNKGLESAGKKPVFTTGHICWVIRNLSYERVEWENFTNSCREGSKIIPFPDDYYSGEGAFLLYDGVKIPLFKTNCLNLVEIPKKSIPQQTAPPAEKKETVIVEDTIHRVTYVDEEVHVRRQSGGYNVCAGYQTRGAVTLGCGYREELPQRICYPKKKVCNKSFSKGCDSNYNYGKGSNSSNKYNGARKTGSSGNQRNIYRGSRRTGR